VRAAFFFRRGWENQEASLNESCRRGEELVERKEQKGPGSRPAVRGIVSGDRRETGDDIRGDYAEKGRKTNRLGNGWGRVGENFRWRSGVQRQT